MLFAGESREKLTGKVLNVGSHTVSTLKVSRFFEELNDFYLGLCGPVRTQPYSISSRM